MKIKQVHIVIALLFLAGCGGQSSGFAPGPSKSSPAPTPGPAVDRSGDHLFKYGQTSSTPAGWEVSLDVSDPVKEKVLANGWTVEVKND